MSKLLRSVNKTLLIGVVGVTPQLRTTSNGTKVTNFTVSTVDTWKDKKTGEIKKTKKWHKIVAWGKVAERVTAFMKKNQVVLVEGPISYREYEDKNGNKWPITEIKAIRVEKLMNHYNDNLATKEEYEGSLSENAEEGNVEENEVANG